MIKNKPFEYFIHQNTHDIYIEDRGNRFNRYAVYYRGCQVDDLLNKKQALKLANSIMKEDERERKTK